MKVRLDEKILKPDPRLKEGYYSDMYFNRTKEVLEKDDHHPIVRMQIFQKKDAVLCGIDESIVNMKVALGDDFYKLNIKALPDGSLIKPYETVMLIEGDYSLFPHVETFVLGALARRTKVATNVYNTLKAANVKKNKFVMFFPARFDTYQNQAGDGYAYNIALQALNLDTPGNGVSTVAQGDWWGSKALGTMPHSLIAAYNGNTVLAALKFSEYIDPSVKRIVLVDYDNDCVKTTLDVADAMLSKYLSTNDERYKLFAVRLDTSESMVDKSVFENLGQFKPTGVNETLVWNVYNALKEKANSFPEGSLERKFYDDIGIVVSGGFTPEKILRFEENDVPVIGYGVGSSLFKGSYDFTADIVSIKKDNIWVDNAKAGRKYNPNSRLEDVEF